MKKILSLLLVALMLVGMLPMNAIYAHAAEVSETLSIYANTGILASDSQSISWTSNGVTFTNDKASSTTAIRTTDSAEYRIYAKSAVTISAPGNITKIVVTCTSSSYAEVLKTSAGDVATVSESIVTIVPAATSSYTISSLSAQTRVSEVEVTYVSADSACEHTNREAIGEAKAASCTEAGITAGEKCADCGVILTAQESIPATGHTYVDGVCSCGVVKLVTHKAASVKEGDQVIIVCESKTVELSSFNGTSYANGEAYIDTPNGLYIWTVEAGASDGTYAFAHDGNYLAWSSGNSAKTATTKDANSSWNVTFDDEGNALITNAADSTRKLQWNASSPRFAAYTSTQTAIQLYTVVADGEGEEPACEHTNTTTSTVAATCTAVGSETVVCDDCGETVSTTELPMIDHTYVDNICSVCGAEFEGEVDTTDPEETEPDVTEPEETEPDVTEPEETEPEETEPTEEVKITFELGNDGDASHKDGSTATTYTETVDGYTLDITDGAKMYTGAIDATGNGCIKLGTSSAVGGFTFTVPTDVTQVIIRVAKYKANTTKFSVNGTDYTLTQNSNDGAYDEITVDTSSSKTVSVTTVTGGVRAMVNSITFVCGKTDHTCQWDEGIVTVEATCTTDGERTYSCTVDGCTITKTEKIEATGHSYVYGEAAVTCSACDYSAAYTLSTIATAKAASGDGATYYVKGVVTYVNGKNVYIQDETGGICVYFATADAASGIVLGDEILVWDSITTYNGLIETTNTTAQEYLKVSSGNDLPSQTVTIADLNADTTNEYLGERVVIENVTIGTINASGNTALTDANGNTINIYKVSGLNEDINANDVVNATVIVSTYNAYQLLVNPGTVAADVVEVEHHDEVVIETVTIAETKAGTVGEYYQVEGVVTFIDGRNVYIQDETGGIVIYLTANASTTKVGDKVKAYGTLKTYYGLIELDGINETDTEFYEILSSGNTVDAQAITIADLAADTTNEYLAEKITLTNVYVSYFYGYSSTYANVNYILKDGENTAVLYRVPATSEEAVMAGGTIVTVEAIVSSNNGYQLRVVGIDSITVTGTCAHETTELVNVKAATLTEGGYTGDHECTVCGNYTERGTDTDPLTDVTSWGLVLRDAIDVKFQINIDSSILDAAVVKITVGEKTYEYKASEYVNADDSYVYVSASVAAAQMTDEITVTVINGEDKAENSGYTIKSYAETILSGDYDENTKALVTAMVHYGAAAQTYFAYNLDSMVNEIDGLGEYTEPDLTGIEIAAPSVSGSAEGITFYGASLVFENKIAVRFYFVGDAGEIEGAVAKDDKFYIEAAGINPQDLDDAVTVTIGELSVSYSPLNYIVRMAEKNENEDLVALVKALYNYHAAAEVLDPDAV